MHLYFSKYSTASDQKLYQINQIFNTLDSRSSLQLTNKATNNTLPVSQKFKDSSSFEQNPMSNVVHDVILNTYLLAKIYIYFCMEEERWNRKINRVGSKQCGSISHGFCSTAKKLSHELRGIMAD